MSKRYRSEGTTKDGRRIYREHPMTGAVMTPWYTYDIGRSDDISVYDSMGLVRAIPVPTATPTPDDALRELRNVDGMKRFTEREKDVMILCVALGMSDNDAAEHLGIASGAVRIAKMRALAKCEHAM